LFLILAAKTLWPYIHALWPSRAPASLTFDGIPEDFESRRDAVESYARQALGDPNITDELIQKFKEAALADPSIGDDGPPELSDNEAQAAHEGLRLGFLDTPPEDLVVMGRELGQYSKGILDGPIEFRGDPDFRCRSKKPNPTGDFSEILIAKPVYLGATYVRYRPHTGLSPHDISDFATFVKVEDQVLTYLTVLKDDPKNQIELRVLSSLDSEPDSKSVAELSGIINGEDIKMDFNCTRGTND
jgi:hypothetical protein